MALQSSDSRANVRQDGDEVVFAGISSDLVAAHFTLTGEHLAAYVGA